MVPWFDLAGILLALIRCSYPCENRETTTIAESFRVLRRFGDGVLLDGFPSPAVSKNLVRPKLGLSRFERGAFVEVARQVRQASATPHRLVRESRLC